MGWLSKLRRRRRGRGSGLEVVVEDGQLMVRVGVEVLAIAARAADKYYDDNDKSILVIKDVDGFAEEVARELSRENEVGETSVHFLIDKAVDDLLEQGPEHARIRNHWMDGRWVRTE